MPLKQENTDLRHRLQHITLEVMRRKTKQEQKVSHRLGALQPHLKFRGVAVLVGLRLFQMFRLKFRRDRCK